MSEQLTDQVLVERVQKGDQKAFNLLVVRYQHKVASLVSRYVPSGDVPDVVQEAFIKAYRALDSFRGDSAFYTWLYRIAVNTAKNYLVAQGRRPPSSDVDAIAAIMDCPVGTVRSRIFRAREAIDNKVQPLIRR